LRESTSEGGALLTSGVVTFGACPLVRGPVSGGGRTPLRETVPHALFSPHQITGLPRGPLGSRWYSRQPPGGALLADPVHDALDLIGHHTAAFGHPGSHGAGRAFTDLTAIQVDPAHPGLRSEGHVPSIYELWIFVFWE